MPSYLVIARKWRPNLFEEIVGQTHVTRTLRNAVSSGRIAHAYLLSGPRGVGKTTAARILAKSLNCAKGPTPVPCNSCESCKSITSGSSVDVFEIDGASNNSVDNVRELTESVRYVPSQGKYKIYIIDEVHMLSTPAFNALLKTLEEPPPHAVFIFATTEVHKIPATILSRCQRFDFKRIPFRDIQRHLKRIVEEEGIRYEEKALFTLAREADGSLRDAQSLLDQAVSFGAGELKDSEVSEALGLMDREALYELSDAFAASDARACLNIVEKIYDFGYDLKRACSDLLEHIRDLTVIKITGDSSLLDLPDSELERLKKTAGSMGIERLHALFSIISRGYEEVSRSSSPRYSFEMALLKAAHSEEAWPVDELMERLESLRARIGQMDQANPEGMRPTAGAAFNAASQATNPKAAKEHQAHKDVKRPPEPGAAKTLEEGEALHKGEAGGPKDIEGFTGCLKNRVPSLSEPLQAASLRLDGDGVEISSDKHVVFKMKERQIESAAAEFFGRKMRISIKAVSSGAPEKRNAVDPLVRDAVRILGGKVISGG